MWQAIRIVNGWLQWSHYALSLNSHAVKFTDLVREKIQAIFKPKIKVVSLQTGFSAGEKT